MHSACVICGGPNISPAVIDTIIDSDLIICADSGADFAIKNNIRIDRLVGDMDSISSESLEIIRNRNIPVETVPARKDFTDTEMALRLIPNDVPTILVCSLTGRIDHVMTNILLGMKLHEEGREIILTDGNSDICFLANKDELELSFLVGSAKNIVISLVPLTEKVCGVTTRNLEYELDDAILSFGATLSTSNEIANELIANVNANEDDIIDVMVSTKEGKLLVVVTNRI